MTKFLFVETEGKYFDNLTYGPEDDPDGDGYTNLQEYNGRSIPTNAASRPPQWSWWYPVLVAAFIFVVVAAVLLIRRR